jgi:formylmethanofuran dehydrogenase subunit B
VERVCCARYRKLCRPVAELGPVTCAGCGLLCDDVTVEATADEVTLRPDCPLGADWFSERLSRPAGAPAATIDGEPADVERALARAAELLRGARRPLLHGFEDATVEDARAAVALADRLGAVIATDNDDTSCAPAVPLRGASTATLGEIRDRARLVVIWREDPQRTHPRLLGRLGVGRGVPERTLVVVDDRDTSTGQCADAQLRWARERDLDALTSLHMLQRGLAPHSDGLEAELRGLMERINRVPHLAFVHGPGLTGGAGGQRRALALHELVRALCQERHAVTLALPAAPGTRSADDVLAWQSGYGGNVDFAGGHPELATGFDDADVRVRVEAGPAGCLVAGPGGEAWIRTAAAGVEASGTAHRLDGVPLALQAPRPSGAPTAAALLARLLEQVQR